MGPTSGASGWSPPGHPVAGTSWVSTGPQSGSSLEEAQTAKKRPAIPSNFDFDPENGPSPSKRRMHDEVSEHFFKSSCPMIMHNRRFSKEIAKY